MSNPGKRTQALLEAYYNDEDIGALSQAYGMTKRAIKKAVARHAFVLIRTDDAIRRPRRKYEDIVWTAEMDASLPHNSILMTQELFDLSADHVKRRRKELGIKRVLPSRPRKEVDRQKDRERRAAYRKKYRDRIRESDRHWHSANPEKIRLWGVSTRSRRRCRKQASDQHFTATDIRWLEKKQKGKCAYCRCKLAKTKRHVDHIMPLALGGSNAASNIQLLCAACNLAKRALHPIDYANRIGLLL